jgi:hypothetical protein
MYLRRCYRRKDGKRHAYWALVESYRTHRGPRQRVVAWLGVMDEQGRLGVKRCAEKHIGYQTGLFNPDCKQVNIALVVSRCGMPLGYEVFAGNRHDSTTLEEIVTHMEELHGRAGRVWIMDRGLASEKNVRFLRSGGRRYILGTAKNSLRKFERHFSWKTYCFFSYP